MDYQFVDDHTVLVPSTSGADRTYRVTNAWTEKPACTCPGFENRGYCRHARAFTLHASFAVHEPRRGTCSVCAHQDQVLVRDRDICIWCALR